jgi:hypothetical protein
MANNLGKKITCPKCNSKYHSMGKRKPTCPVCEKNDLIPTGTEAKVRLHIRPGGIDDASQGWTEGLASRGKTGAIYLNCEFSVLEGPHSGKKIFSLIGLRSPKGAWWGHKGRSLIRGILNSAHDISDNDFSPEALRLRRLSSFKGIDGLEFFALIKVEKDQNGKLKNAIDEAVPVEVPQDEDAATLTTHVDSTPEPNDSDIQPIWMR